MCIVYIIVFILMLIIGYRILDMDSETDIEAKSSRIQMCCVGQGLVTSPQAIGPRSLGPRCYIMTTCCSNESKSA